MDIFFPIILLAIVFGGKMLVIMILSEFINKKE